MNDFDSIAPYYDKLAQLVFGGAIRASQDAFVSRIPAGSRVLVLGGGTGAAALNVLREKPAVQITYVEKSGRMIVKAKERLAKYDVTFINEPFEKYTSNSRFDVVIAHFFFDLFDKEQLEKMIIASRSNLNVGGILIVADFQQSESLLSRLWQVPLIWLMHRFFKRVCKLQSRRLEAIGPAIELAGFQISEESTFYGGIIFGAVFKLSNSLEIPKALVSEST